MKIIGVVSGKGGVGKTTTIANLGAALASKFYRSIAIVDGNFTTPNLGLHLGAYDHLHSLADVLKKDVPISQATYIHHSGIMMFPTSLSSYNIKIDSRKLKNVFKDMEEYKLVLVDSAPGVERDNVPILEVSDEILIVTNPDVPSVTDALKMIELAESIEVPIRGVEINRVRKKKHELSATEIESICDTPVIATIPEDIEVQKAIADGNPVVLNSPYSPAAIEFRRLAAHLVGERFAYLLGDRLKWFLGFGRRGGKERVRILSRPWEHDWRSAPEHLEEPDMKEKLLTTLKDYHRSGRISKETYKELKEKLRL